jgi:hypothetical protein
MHRDTERMIRTDIRLRRTPFFVALFIFLGTIASFGIFGALGFLEKFLRSHGWIH